MKHLMEQIETIQINDGDVIIVRSTKTISNDMFKRLRTELNKKAKDLLLINCRSDMDIEKLSEDEMKKYGWVRHDI